MNKKELLQGLSAYRETQQGLQADTDSGRMVRDIQVTMTDCAIALVKKFDRCHCRSSDGKNGHSYVCNRERALVYRLWEQFTEAERLASNEV